MLIRNKLAYFSCLQLRNATCTLTLWCVCSCVFQDRALTEAKLNKEIMTLNDSCTKLENKVHYLGMRMPIEATCWRWILKFCALVCTPHYTYTVYVHGAIHCIAIVFFFDLWFLPSTGWWAGAKAQEPTGTGVWFQREAGACASRSQDEDGSVWRYISQLFVVIY